jgi:hypothetical protein
MLRNPVGTLKDAIMAIETVLFVSKRLMPVAAALLLLSGVQLARAVWASTPSTPPPPQEVRVAIGR